MYQYVEGILRSVAFSSVDDFTRVKIDVPNCMHIVRNDIEQKFRSLSPNELERWFGCRSRNEHNEILARGSQKYVDLIGERGGEQLSARRIRRSFIQADFGDEIDVHRVYSGSSSTAWRRRTPAARKGSRHVRILCGIAIHARVSSDEYAWRGVTCLRIARELEAAGYHIALDAVVAARGTTSDENIVMCVPVKSYDAPLDILSLTTAFCYPGFWRDSGLMNLGLGRGRVEYELGWPMDDDEAFSAARRMICSDPSEIHICVSKDILSKGSAEEFVSRTLAEMDDPESNYHKRAA